MAPGPNDTSHRPVTTAVYSQPSHIRYSTRKNATPALYHPPTTKTPLHFLAATPAYLSRRTQHQNATVSNHELSRPPTFTTISSTTTTTTLNIGFPKPLSHTWNRSSRRLRRVCDIAQHVRHREMARGADPHHLPRQPHDHGPAGLQRAHPSAAPIPDQDVPRRQRVEALSHLQAHKNRRGRGAGGVGGGCRLGRGRRVPH